MTMPALHRFERDGHRYVVDPETCFCFEGDAISWDVLGFYPEHTINRIHHELDATHPPHEIDEVVGELEWLRASKSILPRPKPEELQKGYEIERGLRRCFVYLPKASVFDFARDACALFLARSGAQRELQLTFAMEELGGNVRNAAAMGAEAMRLAACAGKAMTVSFRLENVSLSKPPKALAGHRLAIEVSFPAGGDSAAFEPRLAALWKVPGATLERAAKELLAGDEAKYVRSIVEPGSPRFADAVEALEGAGFLAIELDLPGAQLRHPEMDAAALLEGLREAAVYYAKRLLKHKNFRLDPIAPLFARIYEGTPLRRLDGAGTNELAIMADGGVYPSEHFLGWPAFRAGTLRGGGLDEAVLRRFDDVGTLTTPPCIRCWARHLCGGGFAAVHQALNGHIHHPLPAWCDAQRAWMEAAVAAFNLLSAEGVNFTRVYRNLDTRPKGGGLSLFALARAALQMRIGVRPIEEADAKMLTKWENWSEAAYFLATETGMFLATGYDREMDALHPRGLDTELILQRSNGTPFGLIRIAPERLEGTARAWLYFRDPKDYASGSIRKSFRFLLDNLVSQQGLRTLLVSAGPGDPGLAEFLEAIGFQRIGVQREALYLHGRYGALSVFSISPMAKN